MLINPLLPVLLCCCDSPLGGQGLGLLLWLLSLDLMRLLALLLVQLLCSTGCLWTMLVVM